MSTELTTGNVGNPKGLLVLHEHHLKQKIAENKQGILTCLNRELMKVARQTIDSPHTIYTMTSSKRLLQFNGATMKNVVQDAAVFQEKTHFNYNKLQAVLCIVASAAVSIGLLYLGIRWLN